MQILHGIIKERQAGKTVGIPSYCTASAPAIKAIMSYYKDNNRPILIEATANQVNQFGGYTGMKPQDYRELIEKLAAEVGLDSSRLILGGDHLGPLTWQHLPESEAMANAHELLRLFCKAGFKKIHLDTSMRVADDDPEQPLQVSTIARRGAELFKTCMETLEEMGVSEEEMPEFIIGSEVPVPGGVSGEIDTLEVTPPNEFRETIEAYREAFANQGCSEGFSRVVGIVVQPGVEYSDHNAYRYNREKAKDLMKALEEYPELMFEGHSTDYQSLAAMSEMVEDGVGILKVGPMVTFAYREALYGLAEIEKWLLPASEQSNLVQVIESELMSDKSKWEAYYHGSEDELRIARHFSYSDRVRYYLPRPKIQSAIKKLLKNLKDIDIPSSLISQYFPKEYDLGVTGAEEILVSHVQAVAQRYDRATHGE